MSLASCLHFAFQYSLLLVASADCILINSASLVHPQVAFRCLCKPEEVQPGNAKAAVKTKTAVEMASKIGKHPDLPGAELFSILCQGAWLAASATVLQHYDLENTGQRSTFQEHARRIVFICWALLFACKWFACMMEALQQGMRHDQPVHRIASQDKVGLPRAS